jgi:hypothetical protein
MRRTIARMTNMLEHMIIKPRKSSLIPPKVHASTLSISLFFNLDTAPCSWIQASALTPQLLQQAPQPTDTPVTLPAQHHIMKGENEGFRSIVNQKFPTDANKKTKI